MPGDPDRADPRTPGVQLPGERQADGRVAQSLDERVSRTARPRTRRPIGQGPGGARAPCLDGRVRRLRSGRCPGRAVGRRPRGVRRERLLRGARDARRGDQGASVPGPRGRWQRRPCGGRGHRHRARVLVHGSPLDRGGLVAPGGAAPRDRARRLCAWLAGPREGRIGPSARRHRRRPCLRRGGGRDRISQHGPRPGGRGDDLARWPQDRHRRHVRRHPDDRGRGLLGRQRRALAAHDGRDLLLDDRGLSRPDRLPSGKRVDRRGRALVHPSIGLRISRASAACIGPRSRH